MWSRKKVVEEEEGRAGSMRRKKIGTAQAKPGTMSYGWLEVLTHFDGTPERLPVVIACGRHDGWVLSLRSGVAVYPHTPIFDLAIRDDEPFVQPWPEEGK